MPKALLTPAARTSYGTLYRVTIDTTSHGRPPPLGRRRWTAFAERDDGGKFTYLFETRAEQCWRLHHRLPPRAAHRAADELTREAIDALERPRWVRTVYTQAGDGRPGAYLVLDREREPRDLEQWLVRKDMGQIFRWATDPRVASPGKLAAGDWLDFWVDLARLLQHELPIASSCSEGPWFKEKLVSLLTRSPIEATVNELVKGTRLFLDENVAIHTDGALEGFVACVDGFCQTRFMSGDRAMQTLRIALERAIPLQDARARAIVRRTRRAGTEEMVDDDVSAA
jgi:hypothetical protein